MKYSKFPIIILSIFMAFTLLSFYQIIPTGLELLNHLKQSVGESWFWLAVFCIFLEALIVISLYFPGQYIAVLLVVLSVPTKMDIVLLTIAMVIAATAGSIVNYAIGRYLHYKNVQKEGSIDNEYQPISFKTLLPAMIHSSGLAIFTFHWGMKKGTPWLIFVSALINLPYYLLIVFATVAFGEQIIQATDNPLIIGSALTIWLVVALYFDWVKTKKVLINN